LPSIRSHFYSIMEQVMQQADQTIIDYYEYIASNLAISQFINSFDRSCKAHLVEIDKKGLLLVNRILIMYDQQVEIQMKIINRLLQNVFQHIVELGKNMIMHRQIKLNLKLIIFLQFIEELFIRKKGAIIHSELFLPILAKFLLIFETIGLLSFDFPYRALFDDSEKVPSQVDFMPEKSKTVELGFLEGGPLRIFISLLLQSLYQFQGEEKKFSVALELTRFLILNEQSGYIDEFIQEFHFQSKYQSRETLCVLEQPLKLLKYTHSQRNSSIYEQMKQHMHISFHFKQSMVQTPAFITLLLLGEVYELILVAIQNHAEDAVLKSLLVFIHDISRVTFQDPSSEEGEMSEIFFAITDA